MKIVQGFKSYQIYRGNHLLFDPSIGYDSTISKSNGSKNKTRIRGLHR